MEVNEQLQIYLYGFSAFVNTHPDIIIILCCMTSGIIVGWTNFICNSHIKGLKKKLIILCLTIISILFISPLIPTGITALYFIAGLSVSLATIGYDIFLKKIPLAISALFDKGFNITKEKE